MARRIFAAFVLLAASAGVAGAHPHLFMQARYELDMAAEGLRGFWVEWTFDQYFTGSIMMDYDLDGNRRFDEAETRDVEANAFSNLENFDYFTFVTENGIQRGVTDIQDFRVRFDNQALVYRFYVPYTLPMDRLQPLVLAGYDPTFFCALSYDEDRPVSLSDDRFRLRVERRTNPSVEIEYMANDVRRTTTTIDELVVSVEAK